MPIRSSDSTRFGDPKLLLYIFRSASGTLALRVFSMGVIFVTRVLLARTLGIEEFGIFSYALTWLDLLAVAAVFGADRLILRELAIFRAQQDWGSSIGIARFGLVLTTFLSFGIVGIAQIVLWLSMRENSRRMIEVLLGAPTIFSSISGAYLSTAVILVALPMLATIRISRAVLQASEHVVIGQVPEYGLRPLIYLTLVVLAGFILHHDWHLTAWHSLLLYGLTVLVAASASVTLLWRYVPDVFRRSPVHYNTRLWISALIPLAVLEGAYFVNGRIAIVMLGLLENTTAVSLYTVAERIMTLLALGLYATNYALAPHFARFYTQRNWQQLQFVTTWGARVVFLIASIAGVGFVAFADPILALFGTEFLASRSTLIILLIGQVFNAFTGSVSILLTTTYHERETTRAVAVSAVLSLVGNALLIPHFGAVGAALASTFSLIYWNVHLVLYAWRSLKIDTTALGLFAKKWNEVS